MTTHERIHAADQLAQAARTLSQALADRDTATEAGALIDIATLVGVLGVVSPVRGRWRRCES